jgi:NADPH:quinone reductase-like Zn-dependent oxidoreductase
LKIRAAVVWEKSGPFAVEELEMEEPRADEVRVRVVGAGVCHTGFSLRDQLYPVATRRIPKKWRNKNNGSNTPRGRKAIPGEDHKSNDG